MGRSPEMSFRGCSNVCPAEVEGVLGDHLALAETSVADYKAPDRGEMADAVPLPPMKKVDEQALRSRCGAPVARGAR